jgi:hypothetical protein
MSRKAVIGRRPIAFDGHKQSAGTVCVRSHPTNANTAVRSTELA